MLSKVLGRGAARASAKPFVFGDLAGYQVGTDIQRPWKNRIERPAAEAD